MKSIGREVEVKSGKSFIAVLICTPEEIRRLIDGLDALYRDCGTISPEIRSVLVEAAYGELDPRRANAETAQPATERREDPQKQKEKGDQFIDFRS